MSQLDERRARNLNSWVTSLLGSGELSAPLPRETEPQFTARVLLPALRDLFEEHKVGATFRGDGGAERAIHAAVFGCEFYPDIGISYHTQLVLAIEVKFLRSQGTQNALATAFGQAALYKTRYQYSCAFLVTSTTPEPHAIRTLREAASIAGIEAVVRAF